MQRVFLDLERDVQYAYSDRNAVGHATLWRYSDEARARLLAKLEAVPDWDPRHEHEQGRPDPTPL